MVCLREVPKSPASSAHNSEVNCRPRSVTIEEGAPKRDTQWRKSAVAQVLAVMLDKGMASNHLEYRSMTVKR